MQFKTSSKREPEPSRSEFFQKFLGNNFALSDVANNSGLLNFGHTADLPLLRTLSAIHQK